MQFAEDDASTRMPSTPDREPLWKRCLDFDRQDAGHYNDYVQEPLFQLIDGEPKRVLDLGCAAGAFGAALRQRFPGASVVGIEAGHAAAAKAQGRLDRVIHARLEDISFADAGLLRGEFDTVVAADILEHLPNPWDLLVRLRPFLAPRAQIVASIPNTRNITVVSSLLQDGRFDYDERGLLDITHLRFFTLSGIRRLFEETGYVLERDMAIILPSLENVYRSYQGRGPALIKLGRMTLSDITQQELVELCAAQFLTRSRAP
jgi:SAM-dependent methyltransferase